jgi:hypothetical protein
MTGWLQKDASKVTGPLFQLNLDILGLVYTVGLIVPAAFHWHAHLTVSAAAILAVENLVFIGVPAKYRAMTSVIMSDVLSLVIVFIVYGRMFLKPAP